MLQLRVAIVTDSLPVLLCRATTSNRTGSRVHREHDDRKSEGGSHREDAEGPEAQHAHHAGAEQQRQRKGHRKKDGAAEEGGPDNQAGPAQYKPYHGPYKSSTAAGQCDGRHCRT